MRKNKCRNFLLGILGFAILLIVWMVASRTGLFGKLDQKTMSFLFPMPAEIAARFWEMISSGYLLSNIWVSMKRVLTGFGLAAAIGLPTGMLMGLNETLKSVFYPLIRFVSPIPGVAWIPLAILWFGLGNQAAVFIIFMGSLSPIIVNTYQGMQNIDKSLVQVLDIMEADTMQKIGYCIIPCILPYVTAGFRLGLGFAWRVVIAAEMVGVPRGIGYVLSTGRNTGDTSVTLIVIISLGIIMIIMEELLFRPLEKRMNQWKLQE